jgi:hypothetical protein
MAKTVRLKSHIQWHDLSTSFHKNLPVQKLLGRRHIRTDRQTGSQNGEMLSFNIILKKSRLKGHKNLCVPLDDNLYPAHSKTTELRCGDWSASRFDRFISTGRIPGTR